MKSETRRYSKILMKASDTKFEYDDCIRMFSLFFLNILFTAHTCFNSYFPGEPGLAACPIRPCDS